jgi:hypothetical protein
MHIVEAFLHKLYIFLLLSSSQKYIPKKGNTLPNDFEKVALIALEKIST